MHGGAGHFHTQRNQRIEIVVERIAERRHEDHGSGRTSLVVVVHDLRKPLDEELAIDIGGFLHVGHIEITVIIVADVFLIKPRQLRLLKGRAAILAVPVRHHRHAVRIQGRP